MDFLELQRDSRVTTGNSGCLLCWPREVPEVDGVFKGRHTAKGTVVDLEEKKQFCFVGIQSARESSNR